MGIAVALAACSGSDGDESASFDAPDATASASGSGDRVLAGADGETEAPAATAPNDPGAGALGGGDIAGSDLSGSDLVALGRDIAIEMHVMMTSDDLRRTVEGIRRSAAAHGGAVFTSDIEYGTDPDGGDTSDDATPTGRATLTLKVPPAELGAVLSGLDELGVVLSTNQLAEDVTEQLVDLTVRIRNAEQSVARVRGFLDEATDLRQMVDLEGELTRRQTDLERLLATQANLTERVALSTLTIDVFPDTAAPEVAEEGDDGIGDAFRSGWDAFVGVVFAVGFVLAILAPFLALAALVLLVAWIVSRSWRHRSEPAQPGPSTATPATAPTAARAADAVSDDEDLARANHLG
jgi:hypothetical protein